MTPLADVRLQGHLIPVNRWALLVGMLGALVALLAWRRLAARTGWRPLPTLATLLALDLVLALTLPPNGLGTIPVAECLPAGWADLRSSVRHVGRGVESLLNVMLLMPLGLAGVLATRRALPTVLAVSVLPAVLELAQTLVPGRQCSPADYLANALGGLIGVGAGVLVERWVLAHRRAALTSS